LPDCLTMPFVSMIEKIFVSNFHHWGSLNNSVFNRGRVWFACTGIASADLNMAWSEKPITRDDTDALIFAKNEFLRRNLPFWWWVFPSTRSETAERLLREEGLPFIKSTPCMVADLAFVTGTSTPDPPLNVICVENRHDRDLWEAVSFSGFGFTPDTKQQYHRFVTAFDSGGNSHYKLLLGRIGENAVATAMLFMENDLSGIYFLTTSADKRRQGIGLAMTQAAMQAAKNYGARFAVLQSSPEGYRVYRRAGFEECCRIDVYGEQDA